MKNKFPFVWRAAIVFSVFVFSPTDNGLNCTAILSAQETEAESEAESPSIFRRMGVIESKKITESSGVAFSRYAADHFWTINDSGREAELYYLSQTGTLVGELKLNSARNEDWESLAAFKIADAPYLLIADVGDNNVNRAHCQLYVFPEPHVRPKKKKAVKLEVTPFSIDFTYIDGARNCEAVAVDPLTLDLWLVEKIFLDSDKKKSPGMYLLPLGKWLTEVQAAESSPRVVDSSGRSGASATEVADRENEQPQVAQRIGDFPIRNVTGMDFSPDGNYLIIRNYLNAHLYQRPAGKTWRETVAETRPIPVPLPLQLQGEAIGFSTDSKSLIVTSENVSQPIWIVDLEAYLRKRTAAFRR